MVKDSCKWCTLGECWTHQGAPQSGNVVPGSKGNAAGKATPKKAAGGGLQRGAASHQVSLAAMEEQFTSACNALYDKLMNLNVAEAQCASDTSKVMSLRGRLVQMYTGVGPMLAGTMGFAPGADDSEVDNIKGKLQTVVNKRAGRSLAKGEIAYTVQEDPSGGGYICVVNSSTGLLQGEYWSPAPVPSKKGAEHAAARAALMAEFPEMLNATAASKKRSFNTMAQQFGGFAQQFGAIAQPAQQQEPSPKSDLMHYMQVLMGRSLAKDEVRYTTEEFPEGSGNFLSAVSLPATNYSPAQSFQGEGSTTKRLAENSAAQMAVAALEPVYQPLNEEARAKKKAKNSEWLAAKKAADLEKKAAKLQG